MCKHVSVLKYWNFISECPALPEISGGQYIGKLSTNYTANLTVTFGCYHGYDLIGQTEITCDINGNWTALPTCVAKRKFKEHITPLIVYF